MVVVTVVAEDEVEPQVVRFASTTLAEEFCKILSRSATNYLLEIHEGGTVVTTLDDAYAAAESIDGDFKASRWTELEVTNIS